MYRSALMHWKKLYKKYGIPDISNSEQGSQYTSPGFTDILQKNNIKISMDGKGRLVDNVFIE